MKQTWLIVAIVALAACGPGCSTDIKNQPPASTDKADSVQAAPDSRPDIETVQPEPAPPLLIAFVGEFDPYAAQDDKITDRVVMKPRPKCGSCHMKATLSGSKLHMVVDRGNKTAEWTLQGRPDGGTMIFEKPKIRVVLKDGKLSGKFTGKMLANINLAKAPNNKKD